MTDQFDEQDTPDVEVRAKNPPITKLRTRADTISDEFEARVERGDEAAIKIKALVEEHKSKAGYKGAVTAKCIQCKYNPHKKGSWRKQIEDCKYSACALYEARPVSSRLVGVNIVSAKRKIKQKSVDVVDVKGLNTNHPMASSIHKPPQI